MDRHIHLHHLAHSRLHMLQEFLIQTNIPLNRTVVALADRIMDSDLIDIIVVCHIIDRFYQHQAHASFVGLMPDRPGRSLKPHDAVSFQRLMQFLQPVVDKYQHDIILIVLLVLCGNLAVCSSSFVLPDFIPYLHAVHLLLHLITASFL